MARQLGMPVGLLQSVMPSKEFTEWQAYDMIDPGEPERGDVQAALVAQWIYTMNRGKGGLKPLKDFLLKFDVPERKSPKEIRQQLKAFFKGLAARHEQEKKRKKKMKDKKKK